MDNYALAYKERSSRHPTLGTRHLYYTRSRAQSPVVLEQPPLPTVDELDGNHGEKNESPSKTEETKDSKSEDTVEDATEGTPANKDTKEPHQE